MLVSLTTPPLGCSKENDRDKCTLWQSMVQRTLAEWERTRKCVTIVGEGGDDEDEAPDVENEDPQEGDEDDAEGDYEDLAEGEEGQAEDGEVDE